MCVCVRQRLRERVQAFEIFDMNALKMDLPPLKRAMALYLVSVGVSLSLKILGVINYNLAL